MIEVSTIIKISIIRCKTRVWCTKISIIILLLLNPLFLSSQNERYNILPVNYSDESLPDHSKNLIIRPDSLFKLILTKYDTITDTLDILLTPFTDNLGNQIEIGMAKADEATPIFRDSIKDLIVNYGSIMFKFKIPKFPSFERYSGNLILTHKNKLVQEFLISITPPSIIQGANLVIDQNEKTVNIPQSVFRITDEGSFNVTVFESESKWPLKGLYVRLISLTSDDKTIELKKHLLFKINDSVISDFWALQTDGEEETVRQLVMPGKPLSIEGNLYDLPPGSYTAKLKFLAKNSNQNEKQDLLLTINVRHPIYWAGICLSSAILFSFVINILLKMRRERLIFKQKLFEIKPSWLYNEPLNASVIWTRAMLKQLNKMSDKFLLTGKETLETNLIQSSEMIKLLERIRNVRCKIYKFTDSLTEQHRLKKHLRLVISHLGAGPVDQTSVKEINKQIDTLETWFEKDLFKEKYHESLKRDIKLLIEMVHPDSVEKLKLRTILQKLLIDLKARLDDQKNKLDHKVDDKYAVLNILWSRRNNDEIDELIESWNTSKGDLGSFFRIADDAVWERLKKAKQDNLIKIEITDRNSWEPIRTFSPIKFCVETNDDSYTNNFLFKHGLMYQWKIEITPNIEKSVRGYLIRFFKCFRKFIYSSKQKNIGPLYSSSEVPYIVQYAPNSGIMAISVNIIYRHNNNPISIERTLQNPIKESNTYVISRSVQQVEYGTTAATWLIALISGLLMFYIDDLTFGSLKDYITLFLWGIALDQTKNIMQSLNIKSPTGTNILGN